jgi:hydroxyquinol 1,2-dioxygenase
LTSSRTTTQDITDTVVASFSKCDSPRLGQIMEELVKHLHAFAAKVGLTPAEWEAAIRILTATGHITDERRQEFILWSDALGLSSLVDAMAHPGLPATTEATVLGPFWTPDAPERAFGESMIERPAGTPALVRGHVLSSDGSPIAEAELDVWQNGGDQLYTVQDPTAPEGHLRGRFRTQADGSYAFVGVRPTPYTIPSDGPVGEMLKATGRHPWRPAHLHMIVTAPGYQRLTTHIFDADSEYLDADAVFAVKQSLVRRFAPRSADDPERPSNIEGPWCSLETDIVLEPARG